MKSIRIRALLSILLVSGAILRGQAVVQFRGSTTTHKLVLPYAAAVESANGVKIRFVANGTGRGLEDLAAGRADVAMITGDLAYFARLINADSGSFDAAKVRTFKLADVENGVAVAIVDPSNPVRELTAEQLQGLFSGKIANWREVGGPDLAVVPVLPSPYDGTFGYFRTRIMQGLPFADSARHVPLATDLPKLVAQLPGAIAFLSSANALGDVRKVATVPKMIPPNYLVTMGEPSAQLKSIIEDFQRLAK